MKGSAMTAEAGRTSTMAMAHPATHRRPADGQVDVAPSRRPHSVSPADRRVQIAAAKARVILDQPSGEESPEWIIALSKEKPE
jgi:hypothetical protein